MSSNPQQLVQKLWNHCNILRDDGLSYHRFLDETGDTTFYGKGRNRDKYEGCRNYYDKKNPLTAGNKLGPPVT